MNEDSSAHFKLAATFPRALCPTDLGNSYRTFPESLLHSASMGCGQMTLCAHIVIINFTKNKKNYEKK